MALAKVKYRAVMGDKIRGGVSTKLGPRPSLPYQIQEKLYLPPGTKTCFPQPRPGSFGLGLGLGAFQLVLDQLYGTAFPGANVRDEKLCSWNKRQNPRKQENRTFCSLCLDEEFNYHHL